MAKEEQATDETVEEVVEDQETEEQEETEEEDQDEDSEEEEDEKPEKKPNMKISNKKAKVRKDMVTIKATGKGKHMVKGQTYIVGKETAKALIDTKQAVKA